jgi:septum site-determining protein MinC
VPDLDPLQLRLDGAVPIIGVPEIMEFDDLRAWMRERVPPHREALSGRTARLDLGDREIKLFDLRRLIHLLRDEFQVEITGLYVRPGEVHRYAERELKLKLFLVDAAPAALPADDEPDPPTDELPVAVADDREPPAAAVAAPVAAPATIAEPAADRSEGGGRRTLSVHRTLRSGASLRFDGDVILFGDVNPGAQVVAAGNVVILGALKGLAHAGATGEEDAFILGFDLRATQLRIGRKIAIPPSRPDDAGSKGPEIAHLVDDEIVIEPYRGKLR